MFGLCVYSDREKFHFFLSEILFIQTLFGIAVPVSVTAKLYTFTLFFFVEFEGKCPAEDQPASPANMDLADTENSTDSALQV